MATIPGYGISHVRKTVTFNGGAGSGAIGTVTVFTITGRVILERLTGFVTSDLVSGGAATVALGATGQPGYIDGAGTYSGFDTNDIWAPNTQQPGMARELSRAAQDTTIGEPVILSADLIITVAGANITSGTIVMDCWYVPITDDGALAGDDHSDSLEDIINAQVAAALATYDPPTKAELDSAVSPLATAAALGTVDTVVDGIKAVTDNLPDSGALSSLATAAALTTVDNEIGTIDGIVDQILADTGTDGVVVAAASKTGYQLSSTGIDDIWDEVVEGTTWTARMLWRLISAVLLGKVSGGGTTTNTFRDLDNTKDRVTATVTTAGDRSTVTKDAD